MKLLWALEPFHQKEAHTNQFHHFLTKFTKDKDMVEASFIVTETETELNTAFDVPLKERFTIYPLKLLKAFLQKSSVLIPKSKLHLVHYRTLSNAGAADRLLALAGKRKCDVVALYTRSSKGLKRWVLGSFAETIVHRSKLDLLIVSPEMKLPAEIKKVVVASDFTQASRKHLEKVILFCRERNSELVVLHVAQFIYNYPEEKEESIVAYRKSVDAYKRWIEMKCANSHVACEIKITAEFEKVSEFVNKEAEKRKADLIVLSAKTGKFTALMGGSVTRQVLRSAKIPVLVLK
jgi:nucleotide-binding universal stress UspA family protein